MLSREITKLLDTLEGYTPPEYLTAREHEPRISVDNIVSRAARYYEKARYSVDYLEEHLLRHTAIERILRRRLTIDSTQGKNSLSFLTELIQAGYLPNNELPERILIPVQAIIDKTIFFTTLLEHVYKGTTKHSHFRSLTIKIATSEIDDFLFPKVLDEAILTSFYKTLKNHIVITGSHKSSEELSVQTYLACRQGLLKDSDAILFYKLWLLHYPEWTHLNDINEETDERLKVIVEEFAHVTALIEEQLLSHTYKRLVPKLKNDIIYYSILQKVIARHPDTAREILNNPEHLSGIVKRTVEEEYASMGQKMTKRAWMAIVYVVITKMILAFSVELPYDIFISKNIHYAPIAINIIFHPLLLFFMTLHISSPGPKNTTTITSGVQSVLYGKGHPEIILGVKKQKALWQYTTGLFYIGIFIFLFGTILTGLSILKFNIVGMMLFIFFFTFVSYFALRIRYIAGRWIVKKEDRGFSTFIFDLLTLPIISLGRWLTITFKSINIFVFIMDFIIEAPFKVILRAIDNFAIFIKEKRDEIY